MVACLLFTYIRADRSHNDKLNRVLGRGAAKFKLHIEPSRPPEAMIPLLWSIEATMHGRLELQRDFGTPGAAAKLYADRSICSNC